MATLSRIRVHPIKALDPEEPGAVRISAVGGLDGDRSYAIVDGDGGGLTDNRVFGDGPPGVTVVSTATLQEVASWFPDLDVDDLRDRFRTNLEVEGVEAFWEDGLVADGRRRFRVGDVPFEAVKPVGRCVVPTRDPSTGEATDRFRERFVERRAETLPAGDDGDVFDHANVLTVLAAPADDARRERIDVGDRVEVLD